MSIYTKVDTWGEVVQRTLSLESGDLSAKIGKLVRVGSLDPSKFGVSHIMLLYALFVDVACDYLEKDMPVNVSEELTKLQRIIRKNLKPQAVYRP